MENNGQQVEITITPDEIDVVAISLQNMELMNPSKPNCCIYTVPEYIKKEKEECYRPFATSIGPVFYKDPELEAMQELKLIFLKRFREHPDNAHQSYKPYINFVREHEVKIHGCYEHEIRLSSDEFVKMIVLDAAFLIYLVLIISRNAQPYFEGNKLKLLSQSWRRDLILEENQLPFFVLKGIYDIAFGKVYPGCSFTDLALKFIGGLSYEIFVPKAINSVIDGNEEITDASGIQHLLDLWIIVWISLHKKNQLKSKEKQSRLEAIKSIINCICKKLINVIKCRVGLKRMRCSLSFYLKDLERERCYHTFHSAKHLIAAGVKFELSESDNPLDITFNKSNGVLKIPKLKLEDSTESALRNVLFFEQCHYVNKDTYFIDYIFFLDRLIDTVDDVQVLLNGGILESVLGSDEEAANLFNKLSKNLTYNPYDFVFSDVSKGLNDYASSDRNKWKAILWSKYFNHPWAIISVFAAIILLILTVLQTITGFLQVTT